MRRSAILFWHLCEETNPSARSALEACLLAYVVELPEEKKETRNRKNGSSKTADTVWSIKQLRPAAAGPRLHEGSF